MTAGLNVNKVICCRLLSRPSTEGPQTKGKERESEREREREREKKRERE